MANPTEDNRTEDKILLGANHSFSKEKQAVVYENCGDKIQKITIDRRDYDKKFNVSVTPAKGDKIEAVITTPADLVNFLNGRCGESKSASPELSALMSLKSEAGKAIVNQETIDNLACDFCLLESDTGLYSKFTSDFDMPNDISVNYLANVGRTISVDIDAETVYIRKDTASSKLQCTFMSRAIIHLEDGLKGQNKQCKYDDACKAFIGASKRYMGLLQMIR